MTAWLAHLYTASGAVFAFLAARAVIDFDYPEAFFWLGVQIVVDATDGMFARAVRVSERLPWFNGAKLDDVLWASAYQAALMLKVRVVMLLSENGTLAVKTGYPPEDILDDADLAAAKWAWDHERPAGRGSDTLPGAKRLFLPMRTGRGPVGVVGIDRNATGIEMRILGSVGG